MSTEELERRICLRKTAEMAKDWDGEGFDPAKSHYGKQVEKLFNPPAEEDPEMKRMREEINAYMDDNIEKEEAKRTEEYINQVEKERKRERLLEKRDLMRKMTNNDKNV